MSNVKVKAIIIAFLSFGIGIYLSKFLDLNYLMMFIASYVILAIFYRFLNRQLFLYMFFGWLIIVIRYIIVLFLWQDYPEFSRIAVLITLPLSMIFFGLALLKSLQSLLKKEKQ